jgi:hypothetical protein
MVRQSQNPLVEECIQMDEKRRILLCQICVQAEALTG